MTKVLDAEDEEQARYDAEDVDVDQMELDFDTEVPV
jgi:hypothetical protein